MFYPYKSSFWLRVAGKISLTVFTLPHHLHFPSSPLSRSFGFLDFQQKPGSGNEDKASFITKEFIRQVRREAQVVDKTWFLIGRAGYIQQQLDINLDRKKKHKKTAASLKGCTVKERSVTLSFPFGSFEEYDTNG